jgi:hypothetical protein
MSADSEEKHEPVSDIDTVAMDGPKALDPKRPIREADILHAEKNARNEMTKIDSLKAPALALPAAGS